MVKFVARMIFLLTAMVPAVVSAEEFILRLENVLYKEVDRDFLQRNAVSGEIFDLEKSKGTVMESLEVHVRSGENFYSKARVGKRAIEIRGELKPRDKSGQFALDIGAVLTTYTGVFARQLDGSSIELSTSASAKSNIGIAVGKSIVLGGMSAAIELPDKASAGKFDMELMTLTLEAVDP